MITFLLTLIFLILIILFMSIGVIFKNKELKGSCGGISESCNCNIVQQKICTIKKNIIL
tara:strand:- start:281 stop:457 length:177 start_codon:yes stop_codon:yes gene_type:complete